MCRQNVFILIWILDHVRTQEPYFLSEAVFFREVAGASILPRQPAPRERRRRPRLMMNRISFLHPGGRPLITSLSQKMTRIRWRSLFHQTVLNYLINLKILHNVNVNSEWSNYCSSNIYYILEAGLHTDYRAGSKTSFFKILFIGTTEASLRSSGNDHFCVRQFM